MSNTNEVGNMFDKYSSSVCTKDYYSLNLDVMFSPAHNPMLANLYDHVKICAIPHFITSCSPK